MNYAWCNCLNTVKVQHIFNLSKAHPHLLYKRCWKLSMKRGRIDVETEVIMIGFDIVVNKVYSLSL